jgi:hypothetical protein
MPPTTDFVEIVADIVGRWFHGRIPPVTDEQFASVISSAVEATFFQGQPQAVLESVQAGLAAAVRLVRQSENGWMN